MRDGTTTETEQQAQLQTLICDTSVIIPKQEIVLNGSQSLHHLQLLLSDNLPALPVSGLQSVPAVRACPVLYNTMQQPITHTEADVENMKYETAAKPRRVWSLFCTSWTPIVCLCLGPALLFCSSAI